MMICRDAGSVTAILCELKLGEAVTTFRTSGFGVETVEWKNFSFAVWSVGGQDKAPSLVAPFLPGFYVVDSNDRNTVVDAQEELDKNDRG